jgi:pyruvate/2-oxoglutarate dehydrogenase complex dihydrolipoamide acyltransferase (E2) component
VIVSITAPLINPNDDQVGVVGWHVKDGDYIEVGAELVDLETSKATVTVEAEVAGYVRTIAKKGDIIHVGSPICHVADSADESAAQEPSASALPAESNIVVPATQKAFASTRLSQPAAKLIEELELDARDFAGAGLVTTRVVRARQGLRTRAVASAPNSAIDIPLRADPAPVAARTESVSLAKRTEIRALSIGESGLINSTLSVYFDSAAIRARLEQGQMYDGSIQPLLLYEISRLLQLFPQFTAYFDSDSVHFYDRIDLGLAIDLGAGLKVVTIKRADTLSPTELFEKTIDFGRRCIANRLRPDELCGSTITVTDVSSLDILHFRPLINGRQSAIIGIGGDGAQPGHPMSINLAFDHRVATGREAGSFLKELRNRILTYAPVSAQVSDPLQRTTGPACCDRCGIDYETYTREFGRQANLLACFNQNGSLVGICHRCYDGWV